MTQIGSDSERMRAVVEAVRETFPGAQVVESSGWRGGYWERRDRRRKSRSEADTAKARESRRELSKRFGLSGDAPGRERPAEPGAATAAPSLEELTLNTAPGGYTGQGWAVTLMEFPGGEVECRAYFVGPKGSPRSVNGPETEFDDRPEAPRVEGGERFLSSVARSRASCIRRCMALQADHMLTLTKRGKFESIDEAWRAFDLFSKSMRRKFKARWRFVAVPELHKEGGYHMHVALNGFWWAGILRRLWYRALGGTGNETGNETPGNIDLKSFVRVRKGGWRVARYVAKYLGKGFSALDRGRRSYSCSSGLHPTRVTRWREPVHFGHTSAALAVQRRLSDVVRVSRWETYFWCRDGRSGFVLTGGG